MAELQLVSCREALELSLQQESPQCGQHQQGLGAFASLLDSVSSSVQHGCCVLQVTVTDLSTSREAGAWSRGAVPGDLSWSTARLDKACARAVLGASGPVGTEVPPERLAVTA